jgi:hypothetical protein
MAFEHQFDDQVQKYKNGREYYCVPLHRGELVME